MDPPIPPQSATASNNNANSPKDPTTILKGKRTKRQRPISFTTHSSTSYINPINSSPTSSHSLTTTAQDEDTANCLILLSKGHNHNINIHQDSSTHKFTSKKYIQTSTSGIYVYECKTCSRTFPSFQALGGHRASHKKPKLNQEFHKPNPPTHQYNEPSPQLLQLKDNQSYKQHECSICGAEFNSGQALGGHMRRHRAANVNVNVPANSTTTLALIPYSSDRLKLKNDGLCLGLDLNLPAPETAVVVSHQDERESGFKFTGNQQSSVRLSAGPTLVDCYY